MHNSHKTDLLVVIFIGFSLINLLTEITNYFGIKDPTYLSIVAMIIFAFVLVSIDMTSETKFKNLKYIWISKPLRTITEAFFVIVITSLITAFFLIKTNHFQGYLKFTQQNFSFIKTLIYFCSVVIQQFLFRGVFLNFMEHVYLKNWSLGSRVLFSSTVFSIMHEVWGVPLMLATFLGNAVLHFLYERQKNLLGVLIVHLFHGLLLFPFFFHIFRPW